MNERCLSEMYIMCFEMKQHNVKRTRSFYSHPKDALPFGMWSSFCPGSYEENVPIMAVLLSNINKNRHLNIINSFCYFFLVCSISMSKVWEGALPFKWRYSKNSSPRSLITWMSGRICNKWVNLSCKKAYNSLQS